MALLGQEHPRPRLGTWAQTKAFWFAAMGYQIHAREVVAFHESLATTLIVEAPARGAKSYSTAHDLLAYGLPSTKPLLDSRHAIVGCDYATNKEFEYLFERLVNQRQRFSIEGVPAYKVERANHNPRSGDMEIVLNLGRSQGLWRPEVRSVWRGLSSQNETSLQGEQWTTVTLSEAAEHPEHILSKHFATRAWRTYLPTTPKAKAKWLRELSDAGRSDPGIGIETFHFPKEANPLYDHANFERQEKLAAIRARALFGESAKAQDDPYFAEQFLGRWVYYAGRVLPFDRRLHVIDRGAIAELLPQSAIWLSTDYGYKDPWSTGLWAVLPNEIVVRFDEIYERELTTQAFVVRLDEMLARNQIERRQLIATGDPSYPQVARLLQDEGIPVVAMDRNAQRDRAAGKRRIADLLVSGPVERDGGGSYPGMYFTSNCVHAIEEFENLHYRDGVTNEDGTRAFAGPDHVFDECRYFVMSRPFPQARERERDWIREYRKSCAPARGATMYELAGTALYG